MKTYIVVIHIMPHEVLLDPAGKTTLQALHKLGFDKVINSRIGKRIEITLQANHKQEAHSTAEQIAKQLLVNPIVENFFIEIKED